MSFVSSAITYLFLEPQTPDFAWKFVWTVPTNYEKKLHILKNKMVAKYYVIRGCSNISCSYFGLCLNLSPSKMITLLNSSDHVVALAEPTPSPQSDHEIFEQPLVKWLIHFLICILQISQESMYGLFQQMMKKIKQNGRQILCKYAITQPFFVLQTPDLAKIF